MTAEVATHYEQAKDSIQWKHVQVPDKSDQCPPEDEALRQHIEHQVEGLNRILRENPEWTAPEVTRDELTGERSLLCNNLASETIYAAPGMHEWREQLVPSAIALYPLQYPDEPRLPSGGEIDEETRGYFTYALDAIGIRTRAEIMRNIAAKYVSANSGRTEWVSLACGAAVPVLNAIPEEARDTVHVEMIDLSERALDFAGMLATDRGFEEGKHFTRRHDNLLRSIVASNELVRELGEESAEMVDAMGIFEYFDDKTVVKFLEHSYQLVAPGGALVVANMLDNHPQLDFNQRGIGWPKIYPRSRQELQEIFAKANLSPENITGYVAQDGVYGVFEITKPLPSLEVV